MKIVSLLPSATEIVYALGLGDSLVGVSEECDYPADAVDEAGRLAHRASAGRAPLRARDRRRGARPDGRASSRSTSSTPSSSRASSPT